MTDEIVRTFFGFPLPRAISSQAGRLRTLVDDPKRAVRWVRHDHIHLTVRFLGDTPRKAVEDIAAALAESLADQTALEVAVEGAGVFPAPGRPRVLWMGVAGDIVGLQDLEESIHQVVDPRGFPREERAYSPHITIGRVRYPQKVTPDVSMFLNAQYQPVECRLEALHLYESRMGAEGLSYIPLATFPFATTDQEKT